MRNNTLPLWLMLTACQAAGLPDLDRSGESIAVEDRYGGTAVMGLAADLQTMNALVASDSRSVWVQQYMLFMPLIQYDAELRPQPWLASSLDTVRVAADTLELTFHLRNDIRWHDGRPTTAEDVRFTFERAIDPRTGYPSLSEFQHWDPRPEIVDSFTIRFRFRAHADYLAVWQIPILPAHLLAAVPPEELHRHPFGTMQPLGNGPFRFVRRVPGQEWVFEANPDFPLELGGRPYLDRVVMRVIPDQTALLTELTTGGVDIYEPPPAQVQRLRTTAGVQLRTAPFRSWTYLGWNTQDPLFADARVRRALSLAIDRTALVGAALHGYGEPGVSSSTPAHWVYDEAYRAMSPHMDRERAAALLREAGWQPDAQGLLHDPQGRPFRFTLLTNQTNDALRDVIQIVEAQLRPLGIRAEPRAIEWNTLVQMLDGTPLPEGGRRREFQAVASQWVEGFRKDDAAMFHSRNADGPYAETGFSHPRLDLLIDSLGLLIDRELARPLWQEYHELILQHSPYAVVYYPHRLLAHRNRLQGVTLDLRSELPGVRGWWIPPADRR
jgi:peptide/nickel transport system substrate-binding protein